jgi:AraC-like DNA-binding protein
MLPSDQAHPRLLHSHQDLVEILLICNGTGKFLVGETSYDIQTGDLLIYNSGVVHDEISSQENAVESFCIGIGGLRMPGLRENALIPDNAPVLLHTGPEAEALRTLYDTIYRYLAEDRPGCEDFCHYLLLALLCRILQITNDIPQQPVLENVSLGRTIQEYIDAHYKEPLTLQDIGDALHLSPYYLSHVFKSASGYSPMQYLSRRRIGEAQNLLISTDLPIARVAEEVGFDTQNYFNLQFSKHVGMPPKKFRQAIREKQLNATETEPS